MMGNDKHPGITLRTIEEFFRIKEAEAKVWDFSYSCTILELYQDNLTDLLNKQKEAPKLTIKKDKNGWVSVEGSVERPCETREVLLGALEEGMNKRKVASTKMNELSSRSHLIFSIITETTNKKTGQHVRGKLSLVDLAGSERLDKSGATGNALKEATSINKSLSALGNVIAALAQEEKHIPYRDNELTMLMSDSIGGNAKTLMFVCFSPVDYNYDETVNSLQYATRVKQVTNNATKNIESAEIVRLKATIAKLKRAAEQSGKDLKDLQIEE
jgi:hypothetical protein